MTIKIARKKTVSVVIPTYNRSRVLRYTLDSIRKQTIDPGLFEVLVVDDGSSDDTADIVRGYQEDLSLRYFYQEDLGYRVGSARNMGIDQALSELIVFIDSGVILHSGCIEAHLHCQRRNPGAIVIGYVHDVRREDEGSRPLIEAMESGLSDPVFDRLRVNGGHTDLREQVYSACDADLTRLPAPWVLFWTSNVSARREDILRAGSFDTNYDGRWGMEDIDLGYNLYKNGHLFRLEKRANCIHYPHSSDTKCKLEQEKVNKAYFHAKHATADSAALLTCDTVTLNLHLLQRNTVG